MRCNYCEREMEPTAALAFWYPELRDKPEAFRWACRSCRTVSTEPEPVNGPVDEDEELFPDVNPA